MRSCVTGHALHISRGNERDRLHFQDLELENSRSVSLKLFPPYIAASSSYESYWQRRITLNYHFQKSLNIVIHVKFLSLNMRLALERTLLGYPTLNQEPISPLPFMKPMYNVPAFSLIVDVGSMIITIKPPVSCTQLLGHRRRVNDVRPSKTPVLCPHVLSNNTTLSMTA